MPTVHAPFQTPQNVGDVEVVENVRVDVTEPLLRGNSAILPASARWCLCMFTCMCVYTCVHACVRVYMQF